MESFNFIGRSQNAAYQMKKNRWDQFAHFTIGDYIHQ